MSDARLTKRCGVCRGCLRHRHLRHHLDIQRRRRQDLGPLYLGIVAELARRHPCDAAAPLKLHPQGEPA